MSSVYQDNRDGRWYYQIYSVNPLTGKRVRKQYSLRFKSSIPPTNRELQEVERLQLKQDRLWRQKKRVEGVQDEKLSNKILSYLEIRQRKVSDGVLSPKTLETDEMVLGSFQRIMEEDYGDPYLKRIESDHLRHYTDQGREYGFILRTGKRGNPVSEGTISVHLRHLRTFFRNYSDELKKDPFEGITIKQIGVRDVFRDQHSPLGDEWEKLYSHLENRLVETNCSPPTYLIFMLMRTGCRVRELLKLKWRPTEDFEFREGVNRLSFSYLSEDCETMFIRFKRKSRKVPVRQLKSSFMEMKEKFPENRLYVFGNPHVEDRYEKDSGLPYEYSNIRRHFRVILKEVGLPMYNLHSLRHGFISKWVRETQDIVTIGSIVGHSTTYMTEHYMDVGEQHKVELSERF